MGDLHDVEDSGNRGTLFLNDAETPDSPLPPHRHVSSSRVWVTGDLFGKGMGEGSRRFEKAEGTTPKDCDFI